MNIVIASYLPESSHSIRTLNAKKDLSLAQQNLSPFTFTTEPEISIIDRAFNYGDGCFTTMYGEPSTVFLFEKHFQRLSRDCKKIDIDVCIDTLRQWVVLGLRNLLIKVSGAYAVKILVSRGIGTRGYDLPSNAISQVVVSIFPVTAVDSHGLVPDGYSFAVRQANMRLSSQLLLAGIKHLNRLEQVLAKRELQQSDCDDLLLCDQTGRLIEATAANIFYRKEGVWYTPDITNCGVSGIMRNAILAFMQNEGIHYQIKISLFSDLLDADAIFLSNAIKFVVPVSALLVSNKSYHYDVSIASVLRADLYEWMSIKDAYQYEGIS
jgi:4-amino-4-deoxychorismate lyase